MLNIKDLTVVFNEGTVNEKKAIDHLSLHLDPGDFVTIIGSNGAGKSTLFGAISGAVETKEGTIVLDDKDITHEKEYVRSRTIGRLFQDPLRGTAPSMTIEENLSLAYQRGKHFSLTPFTHKHHDVFVNKAPLKATSPLASPKPIIFILSVSIALARTIASLSPQALSASPICVFKK